MSAFDPLQTLAARLISGEQGRRKVSKTIVMGLGGLVAAGAAQFLALMLAGAGHGWIEPFFFSAALWLMLPLMAVRLSQHAAGSDVLPTLDWLVLLVAVGLDAFLVMATVRGGEFVYEMLGTGTELFIKVVSMALPLVVLWITLWLSWQIAAVWLLYSRSRRDNRTELNDAQV